MASFLISSSQGKEIHSGGWMWDYRNKSKSEIYLNIKWAQLLGKKRHNFRVKIFKGNIRRKKKAYSTKC